MYHLNPKTKGVYPFCIKWCFLVSILVVLTGFVAGCASAPKAYGIKGEGDSVLNRDINGKSLSVVVRLYQLKDHREFSKLTFDTLAEGRPEGELLGPALIDKSDVVIVPGGSYANTEKLNDETRFVGIVAFFRRPDPHFWRLLVDAETIRNQGLAFRVQDCYVALVAGKPFPIPGQPPNARPECATANLPAARPTARGAVVLPAAQAQPYAAQPYQASQPYPAQPQPQAYGQSPQPYPQQGAAAAQGQRRGWTPQGMPEVNVNANTPMAPTNVRIGSGGINSVTIGEPAPAVPPMYPAQPYPGQPYPYPQPYPAQTPYGAPRY